MMPRRVSAEMSSTTTVIVMCVVIEHVFLYKEAERMEVASWDTELKKGETSVYSFPVWGV